MYDAQGLGFWLPAAAAVESKVGVVDKIGDAAGDVWGSITNLFGGSADEDDPEGWARDIVAGSGNPCPSGTFYSKPGDFYGAGDAVGPFTLAEVRAAIAAAPRGRPGDPPGTVEGLRTAIIQPNPEFAPMLGTDEQLARAAVAVAHGRQDCNVGWQEEPAAIHLVTLIQNARQRGPVRDFLDDAGEAATGAVGNALPLLLGAGLFFALK